MSNTNYKWFYHPEFLDQQTHDQLLDTVYNEFNFGFFVSKDGEVTKEDTKYVSNRYHNNQIVKGNVPDTVRNFIEINESKLIENGVEVPVLFNFAVLMDPKPKFGDKGYGWHKDYNLIDHIQDPLKLWFTMYTLTNQDVDSQFIVSPTADGPEFWNMGVRTEATTNKFFGHNMHLGHEYLPKDKNSVAMVYMRWFDAG